MTVEEEFEKLQFGGSIIQVVEEDLSASLTGLSEAAIAALEERLYAAFVEAGKPRAWRKWMKGQLAPMFLCADERPKWVGGVSMWAYRDNKPMVFIRQFEVGSGAIESDALAPPSSPLCLRNTSAD